MCIIMDDSTWEIYKSFVYITDLSYSSWKLGKDKAIDFEPLSVVT